MACIDLSSLHADEALFFDDCHFNVAGARAVARIVSVGANGASRPHPDPDRGILWSGPLVVLISRVSASASLAPSCFGLMEPSYGTTVAWQEQHDPRSRRNVRR